MDKAKHESCLMISIKQDDEKMFDLLIKCGADPLQFVGENHKVTALHCAAQENKIAYVRKLLKLEVPVDISHDDIEGLWTPLHEAALHSTEEVIGTLLDAGANIEAQTQTKSTPLALASRHYKMAATRYLISRGANVNTQDKAGSTPLIQACLVGATSVAKLLIEVGKADMTIKNAAGATALDEADRKDMWECALYVWSAGCESGAFKTAKGLGPVKWTRPRVLGHRKFDSAASKASTGDDGDKEEEDASIFRVHGTEFDDDEEDEEDEDEFGGVRRRGPGGAAAAAADLNDQNNAASAGALISLAADHIFMQTGAAGAAGKSVVGPKGAHFSHPPAPRYGCATTNIGSSFYLFGGIGYPDGVARYNPDQAFRDDDEDEEKRLEQVDLFSHTGFYRLDMDNLSYRSLIPSTVRKASSAASNKMDRVRIAPTVRIEEDGLTVTCTDPDMEDAEPATAVAATPFRKEDGFSYFEVEVINAGLRGIVAVGLVSDGYDLDKMPGWDHESIGYHADDACAFHNTGWGRQWGKRYGDGDVVGCGIIWETGEVFYSLNGEFLGVAYRSPAVKEYYAAVGFRNALAQMKVNFGAIPFFFDFRAPSLQWERLPSSAQEFDGRHPFHMFTIGSGLEDEDKDAKAIEKDSAIVLLGNGNSTAQRRFWVWKQDKWYSCQTDGETPFVFGAYSCTSVDNSIYVLIHSDNEHLKQIYPQQPVLLRMKFKTQEEIDANLSGLYESSDMDIAEDVESKKTENDGASTEGSISAATSSTATQSTTQDGGLGAGKSKLKKKSKISHLDATWQQIFPKPASYTVPQDSLDNWFNAMKVISSEFSTSTIVGVEGKICFIGKTALALLDPETFDISVKVYEGAVPPVDKFSTVVVGHHIETFGGWDQHSQRNEVNILDTRNAVWYPPHVLGISPRPRNHHSAASAKVSNSKYLRKTSAAAIESAEPRPEEEFSSTCIVHAYGWNGCNYIDDVEVLSLQNKEEPNRLISLLKPIERQGEAGVVNFKFISIDGSVHWWSTNAIVIAARASKWREVILASREPTITIEVTNYPLSAFVSFIRFLHDDLADFEVDRDGARMFCKLVDNVAPEHSKRIVEALVLTRLNIRSRMSEDMTWAFENDLYSDISFKLSDSSSSSNAVSTIKAHKCILMAHSAYFQSLLAGGLAESSKDEITIADADYKPFRIVIQYLYTQALDLESVAECITEVFMLACKYAITDLKQQLESIIAYNLSVENAASLLLLADSYQAEGLKKTCSKFIANHFDQVVSTEDYAPNAELIFNIIQPYLEKVQTKHHKQAASKK